MIKIELLYGDGFTGRTYWVILDGDTHVLIGLCGGSEQALIVAKDILRSKGLETDIAMCKDFLWDGTM